jgi:hypothetical protein
MRRAAAIALLVLVSGCGDDGFDEAKLDLTTPPARVSAPPVATATATPSPKKAAPRTREKTMTAADAQRLRPVLAAWADALQRADFKAAAGFFDLPAIVAQNIRLELSTREMAETFNSGLPCGAKLEDVQQDGRYIVGTFRLTKRPGSECGDIGELVRVAFVFAGRRFSEWYQVPDTPGAAPGPKRRPTPAGGASDSSPA